MNFHFLRTLHGVLNLFQVCFGFAALFACSVIWHGTNLAFQIIYDGYGWQTVILVILIFTWVIALKIFSSNLCNELTVMERLGKAKLLLIYVVCLIFLIFSAAMESWYVSIVTKDPDQFAHAILRPRFITVTVFNWLMVLDYILLIGLTMFCT